MDHSRPKRRWRGDPYSYPGRQPEASTGARPDVSDNGSDRPRGGGLAYDHYLVPTDRTLRPPAAALAALAQAFVDNGYVAAPGSAAFGRLAFKGSVWAEAAATTGAVRLANRIDFKPFTMPVDAATLRLLDKDVRLIWPIETAWTAGLKTPLDRNSDPRRGDNGPRYDIEIHALADYAHITSELIGNFPMVDPARRSIPCKVSGTNLLYTAARVDNMFDQIGDRVHHTCPTCSTVFRPQERPATVRDGWSGAPRSVPGGLTYRFAVVIDCGTSVPEASPSVTPEFRALCERAIGGTFEDIGSAY